VTRSWRIHLLAISVFVTPLHSAASEPTRTKLQSLQQLARDARTQRRASASELTVARRTAWKHLLAARDATAAVAVASKELDKIRKALEKKIAAKRPLEELRKAKTQLAVVELSFERASERNIQATATVDESSRLLREKRSRHEMIVERHETARRLRQQEAKRVGRFVSFANEIAPLLVAKCLACHSARVAKGRVDLQTHRQILGRGKNGSTVVPGRPGDSLLVHAIDDGRMPPESPPLARRERELVRRWVSLGAELDAGLSEDEPLRTLIPSTPEPPAPAAYRSPLPVTALAFSPDGRLLASSGYHEVLVWDVGSGRLIRRIGDVAQVVFDIDFHPDGKSLFVAAGRPGQAGDLKQFRTDNGQLLRRLVRSTREVFAVRVSPDGTRVAAALADKSIRIVDTDTGQPIHKLLDHHKAVMSVAWSPDGKRIASASRDKNAKVFDATTAQQLVTYNKSFELNFGGRILGVAFTPDGKHVASCGNDKVLRVWSARDAKLARTIKGFDGTIIRVEVDPDGRLYTCGEDRVVRIHGEDGKLLLAMPPHQGWVYSLAIDHKRGLVASGSYDGEVRIRSMLKDHAPLSFLASPGWDLNR